VKGHLVGEAAARGVAADRLVFAPRLPSVADHLARHRLADLFLDTLPYNAHTTASDALWAGLPVLTCRGGSLAGRVAASLLHAVGLDELAVPDLAAYEALALGLAREPARLGALRRRLAADRATAPLFDTPRFARNLEVAYRRMWETRLAGRPAEGFSIAV
jgi:predicted O-linked N-acetylglucosamine transferase (SPINDLY family)